MNSRAKKFLLLALAVALLFGSGHIEQSLNHDRAALGLTISTPLENAPPLLAFTTVALGGFRGLISNYLWIRSNDLQLDDKYFEAAQLANWITDLEPHFAQVWAYQAWNMAFNISVKFKENAPGVYSDRWHWVENGISLLRDKGLLYNPDDVLIHRELAWFFQMKMGQSLDDANLYYKREWAVEMTPFFGNGGTNFEALVHPQTPEEKTNALLLRKNYKIDPAFARQVDEDWGPLDWRLPEAHAIYWAAAGLKMAAEHPDKVKPDDLIQLRRVIYQSLLQAFHHGRYLANPFDTNYGLGPDLELVPKVNETYLKMYDEESNPGQKDGILRAHRNFLRDAVYFLYENNRIADAAKWYKMLGDKYPDKPILDGDPTSLPRNLTLDDFAVARVQSEVGDTSQERTTAVVQGMMARSYFELVMGSYDRFAGFKLLARKIYDSYGKRVKDAAGRVPLPPWNALDKAVLNGLLDPQQNLMPYAARAVLRSQLAMPAETNAPTISTNATATTISTTATNPPADTITNSGGQ